VMVDRDHVRKAAERLAHRVRHTPTVELPVPGMPGTISAKLEFLQHTGSFKPRGAFSTVLASQPAGGLIAASGGNHGLAVAYVADQLGYVADIFVPSIISAAKLAGLQATRATVHVVEGIYADALKAAQHHQAVTGGLAVHAYDDPLVVAGQGTVGKELDEQTPDLDTVLVAVGGGGLMAGIAAWFEDSVRIVGVETRGTATWAAALAAGEPTDVDVSGVAADSLGATSIGSVPFDVLRQWVNDSVLVEDDDVRSAQRYLWSIARIVAEPGGAVALAALLSGAYRPGPAERVGIIVCGANTDPAGVV